MEGLVEGFDYGGSKNVSFCESCTEGKHHRNPFPSASGERAKELLELTDLGLLYTSDDGHVCFGYSDRKSSSS